MPAGPFVMNAKSEYLLLFRGNDWQKHLSPQEMQIVIRRMIDWFESIKAQGNFKAGNPFLSEGRIVTMKQGRVAEDELLSISADALSGYLLVQVESLKDAVDLARESPGLEYGELVEVRSIATI